MQWWQKTKNFIVGGGVGSAVGAAVGIGVAIAVEAVSFGAAVCYTFH